MIYIRQNLDQGKNNTENNFDFFEQKQKILMLHILFSIDCCLSPSHLIVTLHKNNIDISISIPLQMKGQ